MALHGKAPWRQWTARKEAGNVSMNKRAALTSLRFKEFQEIERRNMSQLCLMWLVDASNLVATWVIEAWHILTEARLIECHVEGPLSLIALSFVDHSRHWDWRKLRTRFNSFLAFVKRFQAFCKHDASGAESNIIQHTNKSKGLGGSTSIPGLRSEESLHKISKC